MTQLKRLLDGIVTGAAWIGCLATLAMMFHVTIDVAGRTFFNAPLVGTIEIVSAYNMAALSFLPLALIAREKGHIIVELFTGWMKSGPRKLLDGVAAIVTLVYVAAFTWKAFEVAVEKFHIREAKEAGIGFVEIWPARWLVCIGFGLMLFYVAIYLVRDVREGWWEVRHGGGDKDGGNPVSHHGGEGA